MTAKRPSFELFLQDVSSILNRGAGTPRQALSSLLHSLQSNLGRAYASVQLRTSPDPDVPALSFESRAPSSNLVVLSRHIAVRGRQYGRLSVEVESPAGSPQEWIAVVETLAQQLALFAERAWLQDEHDTVADRHGRIDQELRTEKVLARAAGIVSQARGIADTAAREWILGEAARRGRQAAVIAEQVVLQQQLLGRARRAA